jgi:transcription elongation GreA/GreB family factor
MIAELTTRLESELNRLDRASSASSIEHRVAGGSRDRIAWLRRVAAALPHVETGAITWDRAGFGSTVTLLDLDSRTEMVATLSAGDYVDLDAGEISLASPIGNALIGCRAGETITVATPRGNRRFRVVSVKTLPDLLGMADEAITVPA